ncbi:hypothetical protein EVAR_31568_1 [Eumeta japonica]|uniref:Uncharacterized protein n=1 Tax=Eumeta variegata TaxID=151549 RepID=A0A4C1V7N2_EUMVA|nr:hypothetical protein EVAR_31568_1 [Eumeta japonica]
MQAARHRGHLASAECTGTAAPGAYRTLKCPTRRAPTTVRTAEAYPDIVGTIILIVNRCFGGPLVDRKDDPDEGRSEKKRTPAR